MSFGVRYALTRNVCTPVVASRSTGYSLTASEPAPPRAVDAVTTWTDVRLKCTTRRYATRDQYGHDKQHRALCLGSESVAFVPGGLSLSECKALCELFVTSDVAVTSTALIPCFRSSCPLWLERCCGLWPLEGERRRFSHLRSRC